MSHTESPDSPFVRMLVEIAEDPIGSIDLWSEDRQDIIRAHSEGFQRLSATLAFVDALNGGGVGAHTDYVAVQDASSNIYQHISLLIRDKEMAELVGFFLQHGTAVTSTFNAAVEAAVEVEREEEAR